MAGSGQIERQIERDAARDKLLRSQGRPIPRRGYQGAFLGRGGTTLNYLGAPITLPRLNGDWRVATVAVGTGKNIKRIGSVDSQFKEQEYGVFTLDLKIPGPSIAGKKWWEFIPGMQGMKLAWKVTQLDDLVKAKAPDLVSMAANLAYRLRGLGLETWGDVTITKRGRDEWRLIIPFRRGIAPLAIIAIAIGAFILIPALVVGWKVMRLSPEQAITDGVEAFRKILEPMTNPIKEATRFAGIAVILGVVTIGAIGVFMVMQEG